MKGLSAGSRAPRAARGVGTPSASLVLLVFDHAGRLTWSLGDLAALRAAYFPRLGPAVLQRLERVVIQMQRQALRASTPVTRRLRWPGERGGLTVRLLADGQHGAAVVEAAEGRQVGVVDALPERLQDVLQGLLTGCSAKQLAQDLGLSPHTVNEHIDRLYRRFHVTSRAELLALFIRVPI